MAICKDKLGYGLKLQLGVLTTTEEQRIQAIYHPPI